MQQVIKTSLRSSSLHSRLCAAVTSLVAVVPSTTVKSGSNDTFDISNVAIRNSRYLSEQSNVRQPVNHPRSEWRHCAQVSSSTGFATKAEEYDLIVAEAGLVRIEGYDSTGFIVSDVQVQGAVFCLADLFMMWNLKSWQELTPDALSMLHLFKPAPDLVIIGCGLHSQMVPSSLQAYFKQHNIAYEAIDTANAVSTFNILNQEGRKVAGVFLPAGSN
ncbi:hypothetical protein WJX77_004447 [Trebouxia sp. C0004]